MNKRGTILLVEDDKNILRTNRRILEREGYNVLCASTLKTALKHLHNYTFDAIVLDIMMPDGSGLAFCRDIRSTIIAPVLFLTALDEKSEIIEGLVSGGNDYITKPYDVDEFLARIEAQIRLAKMNRENTKVGKVLRLGPLTLDLIAVRAFLNGKDMCLSTKEFSVLYFLLKNEGEILSAKEIYEEVWKQPIIGNFNALWKCISRLKTKLEISKGCVSLTNFRNEGYMLEVVDTRNKYNKES